MKPLAFHLTSGNSDRYTIDKIYTICFNVYMKRYQVYLNQHSVSVLDDFGKHTDISRSKLLQIITDQIAQNLAKVFAATKTPPKDTFIFDSLVGAIKLPGNKKTNFARNVDETYLHD